MASERRTRGPLGCCPIPAGLYAQQPLPVADGPQQAAAFLISAASQRSRGLQLAGRGERSTCTAPPRKIGIAAQ